LVHENHRHGWGSTALKRDSVRAMIDAGRLKAIRVGREWLIDPKDLEAVKDRKVGRPRKTRKGAKR